MKKIVAYRMPELKSWDQLNRVFEAFQIVKSTYYDDVKYAPPVTDEEGITWRPEEIDDGQPFWWDQTDVKVSEYTYSYKPIVAAGVLGGGAAGLTGINAAVLSTLNVRTKEKDPHMSHITLQILLKDDDRADDLIRELRFCGFVGSVDPDYMDRHTHPSVRETMAAERRRRAKED